MDMVYCERNRIKFSLEACEKAKEKNPGRCKGCNGPVACEPIELSNVNKKPVKTKGDTVSTQGICAKCGEEKTIVSRKLCGKCRTAEIDAGTIDQNYPAKRALFAKKEAQAGAIDKSKKEKVVPIGSTPKKNPPKKKKTDNLIRKVSVSFFERDRDMLDDLVESASINRRSLADEILYRVENGKVA